MISQLPERRLTIHQDNIRSNLHSKSCLTRSFYIFTVIGDLTKLPSKSGLIQLDVVK